MNNSTLNTQHSLLTGLRVVITRSAEKAAGMADRLRALGAEPIICPTIAYAPPEDSVALDAALERLAAGRYDWLVLTSAQAVKVVAVWAQQQRTDDLPASEPGLLRPDASEPGLPRPNIAAVGPATAAACVKLLGREPAAVPEQFVGEELAAALGDLSGKRVLLPNADIARPTLERLLRAAGAEVDRAVAYRTIPAPDQGVDLAAMLAAGQIDAVTFTSGSTARAFVQRLGPDGLGLASRAVIACIGPATAEACRASGLEPQVVAEVSTEEGLLEALSNYLEVRR